MEELNGQCIEEQDKDIEIERLKQTCYTLNQKLFLVEDMKRDYPILKNRVDDHERARAILEDDIVNLRKENFALNEKFNLQGKRFQNMESELKALQQDYNSIVQHKDESLKKLAENNDYVIQMEEKVYKSNKISLELLK